MNILSIISYILVAVVITFGILNLTCIIIANEIEIIVKHIIKYKHDLESERKDEYKKR